jgi:hypothetical protein
MRPFSSRFIAIRLSIVGMFFVWIDEMRQNGGGRSSRNSYQRGVSAPMPSEFLLWQLHTGSRNREIGGDLDIRELLCTRSGTRLVMNDVAGGRAADR